MFRALGYQFHLLKGWRLETAVGRRLSPSKKSPSRLCRALLLSTRGSPAVRAPRGGRPVLHHGALLDSALSTPSPRSSAAAPSALPAFPAGSDSKESACSAEDPGSIPGSGRSPGEGNDYPLQYSCLKNSHGQRSLVGYSPWGCKKSDTTERLTLVPVTSHTCEY